MSVFGVFLVGIFTHSNCVRRFTLNISVFNPNAGKCGPEKRWNRTLFTKARLHVKSYVIFEFQFKDQEKEMIYYCKSTRKIPSQLRESVVLKIVEEFQMFVSVKQFRFEILLKSLFGTTLFWRNRLFLSTHSFLAKFRSDYCWLVNSLSFLEMTCGVYNQRLLFWNSSNSS